MAKNLKRSRQQHRGKRKQSNYSQTPWSEKFSPVGSDQLVEINVGTSLKVLREAHDFTIRALAEKSGLNLNTLSLIENGKSSPSENTLQQIALALEVPIVAFFDQGATHSSIVHFKAGKRPQANFNHGTAQDLGLGFKDSLFYAILFKINPQMDSGKSTIIHTGHKLVFCLYGQILYEVEGKDFLLETGDSLCFEAHLPHRWRNISPSTAQAILVMCPTDERDNPTERHFIDQVVLGD